MSSTDISLLPIFVEVDGVVAEIVEAMEYTLFGQIKYYIFSVRINYKGIKSRVFPIQAKDLKDLINKLKIEVTKLKFFEIVYGLPEVRRMIT